MDENQDIDQRFRRPMYLLVKALEMSEVPLLLFNNQDSFPFLEQVAGILDGQVIYASSGDATDQLLSLLGSARYIFLVIDVDLNDQVYDAISYYLHMRDVTPGWEPELERRYQNHPINPKNRLTIVTELDILRAQRPERRRHLQELSTVIAVQ